MQTDSALSSSALSSRPVFLLSALREGTLDLHQRLESRLDIAAWFASRDDYRALLERFYTFYLPLEAGLASAACGCAWAELGIAPEHRRKASQLASDLRFLGLTAAELARLDRCPVDRVPMPSSAAELVGCAYVVEGATLGGQIIGRLLDKALGLRPGEPGADFFSGYGARTGAMWQQFRRAAEEFASSEEAARPGSGQRIARQSVTSARRTFTAMESWLVPAEMPNLAERPR